MSQMCPNCSIDNPDDAQRCSNCNTQLRGLLGKNTILSERYQVASVLGCGAMGAVYLATDKRLTGRRCAIKENRPDRALGTEIQAQSREQFLAEASVLARLDHSSLPKVSDYFVESNREYLVMDYVEGEDLDTRIRSSTEPLAEELVLTWADQVLDALEYLHNHKPQPIIHRDIKPANLRINIRNRAKLVDFGLVKLLDPSNPATKVELRGLGTPAYAPLEQFVDSQEHTDARSDIYSLGATLYHLLTNTPPPEVHQRLLNPELLIPPRELNASLSVGTEQAILKAMAIYPKERFQSAVEMRQELANPTVVPIPESATRKSSQTTLPVWAFAALILVLVSLIGGGLYVVFFSNGGQTGAANQPVAQAGGQPTPTPTELFLQPLSDAPTATFTPTTEGESTALVVSSTSPVTEPTATPTNSPTPTSTPTETPATVNVSNLRLSSASLVGTIAYPVFNGTDYDLFFGQADGSGNQFFRAHASQPSFSPDGTRIAFHSWLNPWGLVVLNLSGGEPTTIADFVEDQLPTWTADGRDIIFMSRREGDRKSRLLKVGSTQIGSRGAVLGEGEYPMVGASGSLAFRGWGNTGSGLRLATTNLNNIQAVTSLNEDTAPALSPDSRRIAFMSRRDGNWEIYVINVDGSNLQRLTTDPAEDGLPTWSPDGRAIAFVSSRGTDWGVWAITPDGTDQRQLFKMEGSPNGLVGANRDASRGWTEERISWIR